MKVVAASIASSDNMQQIGSYPDPRTTSPGFTPSFDLVGEVVAVGPPFLPNDITRRHCHVGAHATIVFIHARDTELTRIDAKRYGISYVLSLMIELTRPESKDDDMTAWGML